MKITAKSLLFWTPRILCIVFALFLTLFSFDVFEEKAPLGRILLGLLMHNLPVLAILLILYFSWKREWIGGILFIGLGWFYMIATWDKVHHSAHNLISGPLFLIGILFLMNWAGRVKQRKAKNS